VQTVSVVSGDVAEHGCVRRGRAIRGVVLLDDHLAFGKGPPQEGVILGNARGQYVVQAATCDALVGEATTTTRATGVVSSTVVRAATGSDKRRDGRG
jgi:hypothetical protein